jgi:L-2,4-diaminobutyrate decarboxylase
MPAMDEKELRAAAAASVDVLAAYVAKSAAGDGPADVRRAPGAVLADLELRRLVREGGLDAPSFGPWLERYLADSTRLHHPGELAHQVGVPDVGSALADLVHCVANQPMSIYEMGAAAAAVELTVLEWMAEKVGWDAASSGGVLTHGGSLANLTALLAARAQAAPDAWAAGAPRDLGARDGLEVGDDRERLGLGGSQRRRARAGEQPPCRLLGIGMRGERPAARELAQHHAAALER